MALKMKKSPPTPLPCALTQKCVCNSFGICTCKSLDLKSPGMNSYKNYRGVGGLRVLQRLDLTTVFVVPTFILLCCCDLRPKHTAVSAPREPTASPKQFSNKSPRLRAATAALRAEPMPSETPSRPIFKPGGAGPRQRSGGVLESGIRITCRSLGRGKQKNDHQPRRRAACGRTGPPGAD